MQQNVSFMPFSVYIPRQTESLEKKLGITFLPKSEVNKFKTETTRQRCLEINALLGQHPLLTRVLYSSLLRLRMACAIAVVSFFAIFSVATILYPFIDIPPTYYITLALITIGSLILVVTEEYISRKFARFYSAICNISKTGWEKVPYAVYLKKVAGTKRDIPAQTQTLLNRVSELQPVTIHEFNRDPFASVGSWPREQYITCWNCDFRVT